MEFLFLGTGSGLPSKERNVTALALTIDNSKGWYLVDCGEATQHQLQRTHLSINTLQAIFITHLHGDHCYGLPGFLDSAAMSGRTQALPFIAPRAVWQWIVATKELTKIELPFALEFYAVEDTATWQDEAVNVAICPLSHRVPSYGFAFTEICTPQLDVDKLRAAGIPQGQIWGQLQHGADASFAGQVLHASDYLHPARTPRKIIVGGDNDQPNLLRAACADAQVLIHEATYTQAIWDKVGPSVQHSSAAQVARFAEEVQLPHLVLTHFSQRYKKISPKQPQRSPSILEIEQEARAHYRGQLFLAADFARFHLHKDGSLHATYPRQYKA